jgi:hypothetical protein
MLAAIGAVTPTPALGAYGDQFGIAPINDGAGPLQDPPVFDGQTAFWAGTCDRTGAPSAGSDLAPLGGIGSLPTTVPAPTTTAGAQFVQVAAPSTPEHCIDFGTLPEEPSNDHWSVPPSWRLAAATEAGSHVDGSTTMWMSKGATNVPDGNVDNIRVDLPPGFLADPKATPKCTAEQFAVRPLLCPPETQVGVLRLQLVGPPTGANHLLNGVSEEIMPIYNLEPRTGNVAELGFGYAASNLGPQGRGFVTVRIVAKARTNSDFGVTGFVGQIPAGLPLISQSITLWGVPWDSANDVWRAPLGLADGGEDFPDTNPDHPCRTQPGAPSTTLVDTIPWSGLTGPGCPQSYEPSWGDIKPFVSVETDCNQAPVTRLAIDSYQHPGGFTAEGDHATVAYPGVEDENAVQGSPGNPTPWKTYVSQSPAVTDCHELGFAPDIAFESTSSAADGAAGLKVDLEIPQNTEAPFDRPALSASQPEIDGYVDDAVGYWKSDAGRATAHLKDTVVRLPPGLSVNPSGATGLSGCSDAQIGLRQLGSPPLFNNGDPFDGVGPVECPHSSIIGTAKVTTPLLDEELTGEVVLGEPKSTNPTSGEMLRMFLVLRNKERGLVAKVYGSAVADGNVGDGGDGQLTATFANNPEVPFDSLELEFKGGPHGLLAMPPRCGSAGWTASFTPWSSVGAAVPVPNAPDGGAFAVDANCGFGFSPTLAAGMDTQTARANGAFSFRFARPEGQQSLRGLTAKLPTGLLASVKDLPLCSNAAANAGACPAGSKIGLVDAKAGSGDPFVLEQKGEVFLTEGYKGGPYGLAVKIRPIAGPFRGAMELSPIIVRQAIHVDRRSAQVTAISDPFPLIHHGVPLRVREVTVLVNRGGFMLNPSDCSPKQVGADIVSAQGTTVGVANRFQASGCAALPFKPRLGLRLTGRKQVRTGKHPAIRALVRQNGVGEAGIGKAEVRLPKTLALDVDNAQALCEFEDGTKPDLENHCPKGSIVGRARARTPLLNDDLAGNVYFVKNVRIDPDTGNEIRTLPMIIAALRGEIAVNLIGESDVKGGKLVNTFDDIPDAPISQFNLNIRGGKNGILAVTRTRRSLINLCSAGRQIAEADMDGQNGKRHDFNVNMRKPCPKRRPSAAAVCRKRTNTKPALRRCITRVKAQRAKAAKRQAAAKRKAAANRKAARG